MEPEAKTPPDPDDILSRLRLIGISQRKFEAKAGLPFNFISRAKAGDYRGEASAPHWVKAQATLIELEAVSGKPGPKPPGALGGAPPELVAAIKGLATEDDAIALQRLVLEYSAQGKVSNAFLKVANECLSRFQQLLRQKREAQEAQRAGEPLTIEIKHIADWRKGGECPYCGGSGRLDAK